MRLHPGLQRSVGRGRTARLLRVGRFLGHLRELDGRPALEVLRIVDRDARPLAAPALRRAVDPQVHLRTAALRARSRALPDERRRHGPASRGRLKGFRSGRRFTSRARSVRRCTMVERGVRTRIPIPIVIVICSESSSRSTIPMVIARDGRMEPHPRRREVNGWRKERAEFWYSACWR